MELRRTMLFVKDVKRMTAFYRDGLGLSVLPETAADDWVELKGGEGGGMLALHAIPDAIAKDIVITDPPRARGQSPIKLIFQTDDLAVALAHLTAHGAVMSEPRHAGSCDGLDPEGNVFNVFQIVKT